MALAHELNPADNKGNLSEESSGTTFGEMIRDYQPMEGVTWRFGKPNYARVNKTYFQHRAKPHQEGSLEAVVSKIVKNWEVESHHIDDIHKWQTMDITKFKAAVNGGCPVGAQVMADVGPYNMLLGETKDYSGSAHTFASSNQVFSSTFTEGFAWECLEVFSGPPNVLFKWRHFGPYTGTFTDKSGKQYKGNGEMFNLIGMCMAKVNEKLVIESLDIYYNPEDMIRPLTTTMVDASSRVLGGDEADDTTAGGACTSGGSGCAVM
eukprot:TRINITY_DN41388_c0_g1_i1.p1 TRINITY_DN41388_c0_g1~~TRINITY_DN41388_c0_g1_i1.p1  ORF type:complete len:264 (-),score=74.18 TRINITY_DN41388_c0_g1_i1:241-1032(-)